MKFAYLNIYIHNIYMYIYMCTHTHLIDVNIYQPVGIVFFPLTTLFPSFSSYLP